MGSYSLESFEVGGLVLARNVNREEPYWPGVIVDPLVHGVPESIKRLMQPGRLCVMFYGPPINSVRARDYKWVGEDDGLLPLTEHIDELLEMQNKHSGRRERGNPFSEAVEEALLVEAGLADPIQGASKGSRAQFEAAPADDEPVCACCSLSLNTYELEHAEEFGGRCGNCQRLYEAGSYCNVCDKVWMPTTKNMVGCDGCDFWIHNHCDPLAAAALASNSDDPYFCPTCRKRKDVRGKLAALREAEAALVKAQPRRPRSAYNLFAAEIHKQYSAEEERIEFKDMARVIGETWRTLTPEDRGPYEVIAQQEVARYVREKRVYDELQRRYSELHYAAQQAGLLGAQEAPAPAPQSGSKRPAEGPAASQAPAKKQIITPGRAASATSGEILQRVPVICNGTKGIFLLGLQRVICVCSECADKPESQRDFSCTQFEAHCGAGAAKKWKASLRVQAGSVPEVPATGNGMQVGKWLELKGIDIKPPQKQNPSGGTPKPMAPPPVKEPKPEKAVAPIYAPWMDMSVGEHTPIKVRWAGDRCSVCDSDIDFDYDQLVSCDMCGITVHQSCYGVPELPGVDDMWLCRACELKEEGKPPPQCCVCPVEGGALKPTDVAGLWCHATCMQWIPEVTVDDVSRMEPVMNIKGIQKERWELLCCICKQRVGAKVQCTSCYTAYHPLCARIAGLHMEILDGPEGHDGPVRLVSYCPKHCSARPELSGAQPIREGEEEAEEDADNNGLWNGQPFRMPPCAGCPDCSAGAARAQPLEDWERASHGTGMGYSTIKGFWIPVQPPEPEVRDPPPARLGRPGRSGTANPKAVPKSAPGGKGRRPSGRAGAREAKPAASDEEPGEPPVPADLVPLPENTPEQLCVTCAGRSAVFVVRTQRIHFGEQEMSASKFETVCGKGDAKKWKSSLWVEGENGEQIEMMQDWLGERKLDRKALQALLANHSAHEEWVEYCGQEVAAVLDELLNTVENGGVPKPKVKTEPSVKAESAGVDDAGTLKAEPSVKTESAGAEEPAEPIADATIAVTADASAQGAPTASDSAQLNNVLAADLPAVSVEMPGMDASGAASVADSAAAPSSRPREATATSPAAQGVPAECASKAQPGKLAQQQAGLANGSMQSRGSVAGPADDAATGPPAAGLPKTTSWDRSRLLSAAKSADLDGLAMDDLLNPHDDPAMQPPSALSMPFANGRHRAASQDGALPESARRAAQQAAQANGTRETRSRSVSRPASGANSGGGARSGSLRLGAMMAHPTANPNGNPAALPHREASEDFLAGASDLDDQLLDLSHGHLGDDPFMSFERSGSLGLDDGDRMQGPPGYLTGPMSDPYSFMGDMHHMDHAMDSLDLMASHALMGASHGPAFAPEPSSTGRNHSRGRDAHPAGPSSEPSSQKRLGRPAGPAQSHAQAQHGAGGGLPGGPPSVKAEVKQEQPSMQSTHSTRRERRPSQKCKEQAERKPKRGREAPAPAEPDSWASKKPLLDDGEARDLAMHLDPANALLPAGPIAQVDERIHGSGQAGPARPASAAPLRGEQLVGMRCKVFWPDDDEWYDGDVRQFDPQTARHRVWYEYDEEDEWLDLSKEEKESRLQWLTPLPSSQPRPSPDGRQHQPPAGTARRLSPSPMGASALHLPGEASNGALPASGQQHEHAAGPSTSQRVGHGSPFAGGQMRGPPPQGYDAVGTRVGVWWTDDGCFYHGRVEAWDPEGDRHLVHYEDGEKEWLVLAVERVIWPELISQETEAAEAGSREVVMTDADASQLADGAAVQPAVASSGQAEAPAVPKPKPNLPDRVPIVCNALRAEFDIKRMCVILPNGRDCTPTEFERDAGKGASKKWKASIRTDKGSGRPGPTMGDWLIDAGLDVAKAPRIKPATSLNAVRRRQGGFQRPTTAPSFGARSASSSKQVHRENCMCVICKQARRTGKAWAGMSGVGGEGQANYWLPPHNSGAGQGGRAGRGGAPMRFGKRAYLHALPQIVSGNRRHPVWKLPESRAWAPEEWEKAHGLAPTQATSDPSEAAAPAVVGPTVQQPASSGRSTRSIDPAATAQSSKRASGRQADAAALENPRVAALRAESSFGGAESDSEASEDPRQSSGEGAVANSDAGGSAAASGRKKERQKAVTLKERLQQSLATERQRLAFGKSGVHGWGLIARSEMKQDSMIIEYRGDLVRRTCADTRERRYRAMGKDCYLFNVNDDVVIDATLRGTIGRFTNHCCAPSMYTKVLEVDGEHHIVFFARTDIKPGQELTYDYRFKEEEGDNKMLCNCGAPNCRRYLN